MSADIVSLGGVPLNDVTVLLETLDHMRREIEAGHIVAFAAVAIEPTDALRNWTAAVPGVTKLRMIGAVTNLQFDMINRP